MDNDSIKKFIERLEQYGHLVVSTRSSGDFEGKIVDFSDGWLTLNCEASTEFIRLDEIMRFSIAKESSAGEAASQEPDQIHIAEEDLVASEKQPEETSKSLSQNDDKILHYMFLGTPTLSVPLPKFDKRLKANTEFWSLLSPWRNKYDYARKIKDFSRILPIVGEIKKKAELYAECPDTRLGGYLYYLAGLFLYYGGQSPTEPLNLLKKAIELKYIDASMAYAAVLILNRKYEQAAIYLAKGIRLCDGVDCEEAVRALGQCIMQIPEKKVVPIGEVLEAKHIPPEYLDGLKKLFIRMVGDNPETAAAIQNGNIDEIRMTKSGNDLFPWTSSEEDETNFDDIADVTLQPEERTGKISAFYTDRNMGFLIESLNGQTWFFGGNSVNDSKLSESLSSGNINQEVVFSGYLNSGDGKYPMASDIRWRIPSDDENVQSDSRAPLSQRLANIKVNSSAFTRAQAAEQYDQLEEAKNLYLQEIELGADSRYYKSAIKNLASLMGRTDGLAAIEILEKYAAAFSDREEIRKVNHMKANFYMKAQEYLKAAELFKNLVKPLQINDPKRGSYLQQEAYCYYALGNYETAIKKLNALKKSFPQNDQIQVLLDTIKEAQQNGQNVPAEDFQQVFGELSPLAKIRLNACKLDGMAARDKEKNDFSDEDISRISGLIADVRQKRPLERSKFRLTLAWLQQKLEKPTEELYNSMFRYFAEQAEGAAYDSSIPPEVVRCYAIEALQLAKPIDTDSLDGSEDRRVTTTADSIIEQTWVILVSTYFAYSTPLQELLNVRSGIRLYKALERLQKEDDSWAVFLSDLDFICSRIHNVRPYLEQALEKLGCDKKISNLSSGFFPPEDIKLFALFDNLVSITADKFHSIRETFLTSESGKRKALDQARITRLLKILEECSMYALQRTFLDKERVFLQINSLLDPLVSECLDKPTALSIEKMYPALKTIRSLLLTDFQNLELQEPEFELSNILDDNRYTVDQDGFISLKLQLASTNESAPPVSSMRIYPVQKDREFEGGEFPETFGAGKKEFEFRVKPSFQEVSEKAFSLNLNLEYRLRNGTIPPAKTFSVPVQMGEQMTEDIENVYAQYAGGTEVTDDKMFFGRDELVKEICLHLSQHSGQCFTLYGQKRSGKSSVVHHVGKKLPENCVFTYIDAMQFNYNREKLLSAFVTSIYDPVIEAFDEHGIELNDFPTYEEAKTDPIRTLHRISKLFSKNKFQWVVAVDEFTSLNTDKKEEVTAFMHAWKSFLGANLFNALIIGQDTMPRFRKDYPNDFCVTHDTRISFLSKDSCDSLAEEPIRMKNGESRYKGQAKDKLYQLTAGSPYLMQILCAQVVKYLNRKRQPYITGADIEIIAEMMTRGENRLGEEIFDGFVTPGDEINATVPNKDLWRVLTVIAQQSRLSGWCSINELEGIENATDAVKDLIERGTLEKDEDKLRIKVELFSRWLRINMRGI